MSAIIQQLNFGSLEHQASIQLRDLVLRKPLGMQFTEEQLAAERDQLHYGLFVNGVIRACLVVKMLKEKRVKIRQVAVHPDFQRQGLGKKLSLLVEEEMSKSGVETIELHARETATPFYKKLHYQIQGELFDEIGIPHYKMVKQLV